MMLYVCSLDLLVSVMFYECYASRFSRRSDKIVKILIFASFFSPFIFYLHEVALTLSIIQASFGFGRCTFSTYCSDNRNALNCIISILYSMRGKRERLFLNFRTVPILFDFSIAFHFRF